ncbi:hypothetical protein [Roseibium sp.]|uniref:hypothetical protein n=1 Tax=Roseibium sp. TaxID=1936156 RepID=UPI003BAF126E
MAGLARLPDCVCCVQGGGLCFTLKTTSTVLLCLTPTFHPLTERSDQLSKLTDRLKTGGVGDKVNIALKFRDRIGCTEIETHAIDLMAVYGNGTFKPRLLSPTAAPFLTAETVPNFRHSKALFRRLIDSFGGSGHLHPKSIKTGNRQKLQAFFQPIGIRLVRFH